MKLWRSSPLLAMALCLALFSATPLRAEETPSPVEKAQATADSAYASADTAWMLVSTGLVMLMVPGLALFYGGIARRKNILGTMMHSMVALAIVGIQWLLFGYCLAFGASQGGYIGWSPDFIGLQGVKASDVFAATKIPIFLHCMYQGMFAIITPALISGALAERIKFGPYCLFLVIWSTVVYAPLAHWVWALQLKTEGEVAAGTAVGWLGAMGALDFAGGTVVHIAAGVSGLAAILVLRKRVGYPEHAIHPSSMVMCLLGAGLLWFGWFGFNGGSAIASSAQAVSALAATQIAAAAAALVWMLVEWAHKGKPTALGFATGLVAGLVAVTPASGFVSPMGALFVGSIAAVVCYIVVSAKPLLGYDDSLDAFGVHGVGGFVGAVLTGVFVSIPVWTSATGLGADAFVGAMAENADKTKAWVGVPGQVIVQLIAAGVAALYAFVATLVIAKVLDLTIGFTLNAEDEAVGLDQAVHGETGFDLGPDIGMGTVAMVEPRAANVPPNGQKRFTVVVEGNNDDLMKVWSRLCQASEVPPMEEFRAVYPYLTTVQESRFQFRGGDQNAIRENLQRLFEKHLGGRVRAYVEN